MRRNTMQCHTIIRVLTSLGPRLVQYSKSTLTTTNRISSFNDRLGSTIPATLGHSDSGNRGGVGKGSCCCRIGIHGWVRMVFVGSGK